MRGAQNDANSEEAFEIAEFTGLVYSCEPATGDRAASNASSGRVVVNPEVIPILGYVRVGGDTPIVSLPGQTRHGRHEE